ncbi:cytochrome c oxidase accessory protein CcoG [Flavobacterium columnare NBRC 100251 = ATCC 23463]|uniref:cytochrome c oxidase accessory protein CcoG n=1 Tax=Flavobacterium columnare TaxID=996 RepID=UPI000BE7F24C|nr:cytochrome c oxidase accessory protein CcoG [Flavobacterium columnare]PDS22881.1 cytochrome c oxidase accessory protein CcoG [Flavobacterium columnare NBRC 100251 = ATCC 23463]GEM58305.1 cytochrome c oxidase accessory protein CcoG [Flavobacterium columnare NBRC 100251 = ATCC 23463]
MAGHSPSDSFRDTIATIDKEGKRAWIFPKKPSGKFYDRRKIVSYFLLVFLFSAPFIKVNGSQFLLFNVIERKFSILGFPFWPQDFHLVVISMIIGVVGLALFTVAFGRIFCGWICPQTIFMEMVFRRIEYWIEGDRGAQIKLAKQEWNAEKIRKRITKGIVFFVASFFIANVFLAYLMGGDHVLDMVRQGPLHNTGTLIALLIFTAVFYFVFAWFREQVCIIACPYGRMQGVLLDNKTINVAYDHVRGEGEKGRAKFKKGEDRALAGKGDCIDCHQCVNVCPTGIDIRNGVQLECVNCTACIDECYTIMKSVNLPINLIRYASEDEIVKKEKFVFTTRMKGYVAVLSILIGIFIGMLFLRNDVEATVLRLPGQLFQHKGENITNVFTYKVVNKTMNDFKNVTFKLVSPEGKIEIVGKQSIQVRKDNLAQGTLFVEIHPAFLEGDKTKIKIEVYNNNNLIETTTSNFLGPRKFN